MISNIRMPKIHFPGFNTKLVGRVKSNVYKQASTNGPVEFQQVDTSGYDAVEKTAAAFDFVNRIPGPVRNGFLNTMGVMAAGAAVAGVAKGVEAAGNLLDQGKYENSLKTAIQMSPTLQRHGFAELRAYMPMIIKASPTVAGEPRLLANYLESMIDAEGHLNMATFAELNSLEGQVLKNRESRNSGFNNISNAVIKGMADGMGKGFANSFSV